MTSQLFTTLGLAAEILADLEKGWALIGGLAVSFYGEPRFTRDIDLAISVADDGEAEDFIRSWTARNFVIDTVIEQDVTGRMATVRSKKASSLEGIFVDLLFASSGIEPEIALEARQVEIIADLVVPVARPAHLFALKLLSIDDQRLNDLIDLRELRPLIIDEELAAAQRAIELIKARGYHRGRDLGELMGEHLG